MGVQLFRWFIGLALDDPVWVATVFSKNRQRLIEHDAVPGAVVVRQRRVTGPGRILPS